ncbi:MAG: FtsX-like permease family protein [Gammaproteobacteria bacterium]
MNTLKFALTAFKRDWKSGELRLIGAAVLIAVACLTSVSFFTDRVSRTTELQATELLAADLVLSSANAIPDTYVDTAADMGLTWSRNESFRSVVVVGDRMELAEVKAVDPQYPIRGELRISDQLFEAEYQADSIPAPGEAWLDSRLSQALQVEPGDTVNLGALSLRFTKVLTYEPDRGGDLFNIAPRLLFNREDLAESGLILPGSRVSYRLLLGGEGKLVEQYRNTITTSNDVRVRGIKDARPEIRSALERAEQFLGLAALVSIALAGMAIAMTAHRYATRHFDNCAVLRCMGMQQDQIIRIYLYQLILLALIAGLLGCGIGFAAQEVLHQLMAGIMERALPPPSFRPVLNGLLASLVTVLAFALPQLLRLRRVSPLRVLRRDLAPLPMNNYLVYVIAIGALVALSPWQSGNIKLTLYTLGGLFLTAIVLGLTAKLLITWLRRLQPRLKLAARYGLANVIRRSQQSMVQVVGIGIGITVMLLLTLVRTDLLANWQNRLPENTPNYFLINIQPDQVDAISQYLQQHIKDDIGLYPMIRGRLVSINDDPVKEENYDEPRAQRLATRNFNLSYLEEMQPDNKLVSGEWWPTDRTGNYFSVEQGIAETLGIQLGDTLTYLIGGQEISGVVHNLRWVEWDSFNVNFFVVSNPEALKDYPGTFISSFYMPTSQRNMFIELIREFPSITVFDVDAILKQVRTIMEHVVNTIEFVFIFTLLTGITVLFAALQSTHDERMHESALMRALGANRKQIVTGLFAEFLFLGLVTGLLSALAASAIEMALAEYVFKIDVIVNPWIWVAGPIACSIIVIGTGLYGTRSVLTASPMRVLRRA